MTKNQTIIIILVVSFLLISGCQVLSNFWPASISNQSIRQAGHEPNEYPWYKRNLGTAIEIRTDSAERYVSAELELLYKSNLNKEQYKLATAYLDLSIQTARSEVTNLIGTLNQPGWLLSALISLLPVGSYLYGAAQQRPQDYNEEELEQEIAKRKTT